jgi:holo-[acyl-carrier protein] synthase
MTRRGIGQQRRDTATTRPSSATFSVQDATTYAKDTRKRRRNRDRVGNSTPSEKRRRLPQEQLSVGVDLVSVVDVMAALERFGDRYVRRIFTEQEAAYCRAAKGAVAAARFAVRFAAKEAAVKALQPDGPWSDWRAIEVRRHRTGRCTLALHREAASLASRRGIGHLSLSMSHDGDRAAAFVAAARARDSQRQER